MVPELFDYFINIKIFYEVYFIILRVKTQLLCSTELTDENT